MATNILTPNVKTWKKSKLPKWMQSKTLLENKEMIVEIKELQITNANNLLRLQLDSSDTNNYSTHLSQTEGLLEKYKGVSDYGNELVKRLVNIIAAIQIPNGIELEGEESSPEYGYLEEFIDLNQLNEGVGVQLAKEAQFHGQVCLELLWDEKINQVRIGYLPWNEFGYEVIPIGLSNLTSPYRIRWKEAEEEKSLEYPQIAYVGFNLVYSGGMIEGWPALGNLLMRLDAISADLLNWKESNKLYAHPTPVFTCETQEEVSALTDKLISEGWTVGNALAFRGKFAVVASPGYSESYAKSIEANIKVVAGAAGVSIAWLGFADVMSNRATAESLGEPMEIVSSADIAVWKSFYEELFAAVIDLRNQHLGKGIALKQDMVKPVLKPMTDRQWAKLKELYMPAAEKGLISRETFLEQIPDLKVTKELGRLEEEEPEIEPVDLDEVVEVELEEE